MRKWILGGLLLITTIAWAGDIIIRRTPGRRIVNDYIIPRSVGAWSQYNDMTSVGQPWWSITTGRPFWETLERARDIHDLTAVGFALRAHPTDNTQNNENIRRAFRTPGIDIIVLWLSHWSSTEPKTDGTHTIMWQNYPDGQEWQQEESIFDQLYRTYGGQDKTIIVMTYESDNRLHGKCLPRDECVPEGWYWNDCPDVCREQREYDYNWPIGYGWWFPENYVLPDGCRIRCCDMQKSARRDLLIRQFERRQEAVEAARATRPDAKLKVFHAVEIDRYGNEYEWMLVARDVLPYLDVMPDFIGLSLWPNKSDPAVESFRRVQDWTGLPAYRFFIAEVGARERQAGDQYNRIMQVVPPLLDMGLSFALVWSLEQSSENQYTLHALVDPVTGEYRSGMQAIKELNDEYR